MNSRIIRNRTSALAIISALAVGAAGCSTIQGIETNLASPTTTQAAQNVGTFVKAFACGLSAAAASATGVEAQTYNGTPIVNSEGQQITAIVYASSQAACTLLNGVLTSTTAVSVPTTAVVTTPVAKALRKKLRAMR